MKGLAWAVVVLGLVVAAPERVAAQQVEQGAGVSLGRNYPNPFNPETWIPFTVPESKFADGRKPVVSIRIYNVLAQLVAIPMLQGSGQLLESLALEWNGTGDYVAYWDGKYRGTDREAASGVYVYQLEVDGERRTEKMTVIK
ncbi:MAG TPA: hypothetical protein VD793_10655 [Gemmatimonadales bacterium]|nr:hypothetical protein [Gemmatimonadales bacterium]